MLIKSLCYLKDTLALLLKCAKLPRNQDLLSPFFLFTIEPRGLLKVGKLSSSNSWSCSKSCERSSATILYKKRYRKNSASALVQSATKCLT